MYSKTGHACIRRTRGCETWLFVIPLRTVGPPSNIWLSAWLRAGFKELPLAVFFSARRRFDVYLRTIAGIRRARFYYRTGARGSPKTDPSADDCSTIALASPRFVGALAVVVRRFQWRQREFKVGGTSLVSRLSACLTEANWWRLIAEWKRLEAERTEGNQYWSAISKST